MAGNPGAGRAEPVPNPELPGFRRRRLVKLANEQRAGRTGPSRSPGTRPRPAWPASNCWRRTWPRPRRPADQHAALQIEGMTERAAEAAQALRDTLQQATLAAEALALPLTSG